MSYMDVSKQFKPSIGWTPTPLYKRIYEENRLVRCPNCGQNTRDHELERVMNHYYCMRCKG